MQGCVSVCVCARARERQRERAGERCDGGEIGPSSAGDRGAAAAEVSKGTPGETIME